MEFHVCLSPERQQTMLLRHNLELSGSQHCRAVFWKQTNIKYHEAQAPY